MKNTLTEFREEIKGVINKYSMENRSNTPDFLLADYLIACLMAFDNAVNYRDAWYSGVKVMGRDGSIIVKEEVENEPN